MALFVLIAQKILPLYLVIALGYGAGRWLGIAREQVANLVIYLIMPIVFFGAVARTELTPAYLTLPFVAYCMGAVIALSIFYISKFFYAKDDTHRNLIGQAAGSGNTGYFGLPLFLALAPEQQAGVYLLAILGLTICEATVGYYLLARSHFGMRDAVRKLLRLPVLYACLAGLIVNISGMGVPTPLVELLQHFRGCYVIFGMMMIGLGLSSMQRLEFGTRFLPLLFLARFVCWPLLAWGLVWLDSNVLHLFDDLSHKVVIVFSVVPLAANTVAFATQLKVHPEKAATAVLLSTLLALITIPLYINVIL